MLGRTLGFVACVFGFIAVVVPRAGDSEKSAESASAQATAQSKGAAGSDWFAGDHTLKRRSDGHFYTSATIDGASVRMMIDTGASVIALTRADAEAAGLYWDEGDVQPVGRGANGTIYGVAVRLSEVEVGGMARTNVDAIIIPEGLDVSLLGQSYLSKIDSVEINGDSMVMANR